MLTSQFKVKFSHDILSGWVSKWREKWMEIGNTKWVGKPEGIVREFNLTGRRDQLSC